jgi:hypothetical protein
LPWVTRQHAQAFVSGLPSVSENLKPHDSPL